MSQHSNKATTLIEIIIAMIILGMVIFGFYSIYLFSDNQVVTANRKAKLQNEVVYQLEFMTKEFVSAIGGATNSMYPVSADTANHRLFVVVDSNRDGQLNSGDLNKTFEYVASNHTVLFCNDTAAGGACNVAREIVSRHITSDFDNTNVTWSPSLNYVNITVSACWDPSPALQSGPNRCGSIKNPKTQMWTYLTMPSVVPVN